MRKVAAMVVALTALVAGAQLSTDTTIQPANPTSVDVVYLGVFLPTPGWELQPVNIDGSNITITFRGGSTFPSASRQTVSLGRLPAGTYSVTVVYQWTDGNDQVVLSESAPPFALAVGEGYFVPSLDDAALLVLAITLALLGVLVRR